MNFLQTYLRRLTNLSSSNRSLLLLRLSKWHDIDFQDFDFLLNKSAFEVLRPLLEGKTKTDICEIANPRMAANNIAAKRLGNISRKNQLIMGESGAQDLHVAYPFVEGRLSNGQFVRDAYFASAYVAAAGFFPRYSSVSPHYGGRSHFAEQTARG